MSDVLPPLDDHGFASVTNAVLSHFPFGPVKTNDGLKMHTPPPTSTWHAHRLLPPSALSHCLVGLNGVVRRIDAGSRLTASPSTQGAHNGHHAVHCFVWQNKSGTAVGPPHLLKSWARLWASGCSCGSTRV